jgi:SulP family sulfate permease
LFSQVKSLLGFKSFSSTASTFPDYVEGYNDHIGETQLYTSILGFLTIGILFTMKYLWRVFPASFIMLIVTTAIVYITEADQRAGIKILRSSSFIPEGLPTPQVPWEYKSATLDNTPISFSSIIETSLIIALVGYMESASVAKKFAAKNHYRIHLSQEMLALSACSTIGSFFQSYPTTGSLSRTSLKYQCGSRSPFSSIFSGIMMGAVLLFVTPAFQFVPLTVISAIIIVAISALLDYEEPLFLWRTNKIELIPYGITFWATMLLGPEIGVVIAVILSMFQVMWFTAHPRIVKIGRIAGTYAYRDLTRFPNAQTFPGVLIIRQDARLYFANVTRLRDKFDRFIRASPEPVKYIILDCSGINSLDATAVAFIAEMIINFQKQKIVWLFATVKGPVRDHMAEVKLDKKIGEQHFFLSVHDAVLFTQNNKQTSFSKPESDVKVNIN